MYTEFCDLHIIFIPIFQALSSVETTEALSNVSWYFLPSVSNVISDEGKHEHKNTIKGTRNSFFHADFWWYIFLVKMFGQKANDVQFAGKLDTSYISQNCFILAVAKHWEHLNWIVHELWEVYSYWSKLKWFKSGFFLKSCLYV